MAESLPEVFLQLHYDAESAAEAEASARAPAWLRPGERAESARDRLRREREEARARLGGLTACTR